MKKLFLLFSFTLIISTAFADDNKNPSVSETIVNKTGFPIQFCANAVGTDDYAQKDSYYFSSKMDINTNNANAKVSRVMSNNSATTFTYQPNTDVLNSLPTFPQTEFNQNLNSMKLYVVPLNNLYPENDCSYITDPMKDKTIKIKVNLASYTNTTDNKLIPVLIPKTIDVTGSSFYIFTNPNDPETNVKLVVNCEQSTASSDDNVPASAIICTISSQYVN